MEEHKNIYAHYFEFLTAFNKYVKEQSKENVFTVTDLKRLEILSTSFYNDELANKTIQPLLEQISTFISEKYYKSDVDFILSQLVKNLSFKRDVKHLKVALKRFVPTNMILPKEVLKSKKPYKILGASERRVYKMRLTPETKFLSSVQEETKNALNALVETHLKLIKTGVIKQVLSHEKRIPLTTRVSDYLTVKHLRENSDNIIKNYAEKTTSKANEIINGCENMTQSRKKEVELKRSLIWLKGYMTKQVRAQGVIEEYQKSLNNSNENASVNKEEKNLEIGAKTK